jgi:hypothetical protein
VGKSSSLSPAQWGIMGHLPIQHARLFGELTEL